MAVSHYESAPLTDHDFRSFWLFRPINVHLLSLSARVIFMYWIQLDITRTILVIFVCNVKKNTIIHYIISTLLIHNPLIIIAFCYVVLNSHLIIKN